MWTVIKKLKLDEYDAIPDCWIMESQKEAKYPLLSPAVVRKMASKGEPIKCAFEVLKINVLKKNYETYDVAYDDCVRFTRGRRSKSSSEREPKGKGRRKKIVKRHSSSESEDLSSEEDRKSKFKAKHHQRPSFSGSDDENTSCEEEMMKQPKLSAKAAAAKEVIEAHLSRTKDLPLPPVPKNLPEYPKESSQTGSPAFMETHFGSPTDLGTPRKNGRNDLLDSVKKQLFNKGKIGKTRCRLGKKIKHSCGFRLDCKPEVAILHTLCSIGADVQEVKFRQKKERGEKNNTNSKDEVDEIGEARVPEDIDEILPLKDSKSFDEFEIRLKSDKDLFQKLVKAYAWEHRNDANITTTARGIARQILCETVLALYSLKGGHSNKKMEKKPPFNVLATYSLIIKVVERIWMSKCADHFEEANKTLGPFLIGFNKLGAQSA